MNTVVEKNSAELGVMDIMAFLKSQIVTVNEEESPEARAKTAPSVEKLVIEVPPSGLDDVLRMVAEAIEGFSKGEEPRPSANKQVAPPTATQLHAYHDPESGHHGMSDKELRKLVRMFAHALARCEYIRRQVDLVEARLLALYKAAMAGGPPPPPSPGAFPGQMPDGPIMLRYSSHTTLELAYTLPRLTPE